MSNANPLAQAVIDGLASVQSTDAGIRDGNGYSDSRRWFHGRGCCYAGFEQVTVDWFDPVIWITLFKPDDTQAIEQDWLDSICAQVAKNVQPHQYKADNPLESGAERKGQVAAVMVQRRYQHQAQIECVWGQLPEQVYATRQNNRFHLNLADRQNTGFFLDMEPGRLWLQEYAKGKRVLNLFAYTCAFSVVAQQWGAQKVVNVDMSSAALQQGRDNHRLNGLPTEPIVFLRENILKSWGRIRKQGPYDVVILDPPSFQKGSFVAQRDYPKLIRRLPELMPEGGEVLMCLNAPELPESFLHQSIEQEGIKAQLVQRLEASQDFPDANPDRSLKLLHFRL